MIVWLEKEWSSLVSKYIDDDIEIRHLFYEIKKQYALKIRHYHNLSHVHNMLVQAQEIMTLINDYDAFRYAIWYHDIIYKPTRKDNEQKSAEMAKKRLKSLNFDEKRLEIVEKLINSTKTHEVILTKNLDNSYLLDIDLSILGTDWETYKTYVGNIRKEYAIYPNFMYKKGRKKVLEHFLERPYLFYTEKYKSQFETQARKNLKREMNLL